MDTKTRNGFLGAAMFLEHASVLQPSVIEKANYVARQGGYEIPLEVEESLSSEDRKEIVKSCATTVFLGQDRPATELEQLVMLHIVNGTVERDFLTADGAFDVMYQITGLEPRNESDWTLDNWKSSYDSVVGFEWPVIERQLAQLARRQAGTCYVQTKRYSISYRMHGLFGSGFCAVT